MTTLDELLGENYAPDCPGRGILDHVVSKWGMLVMIALCDGKLRYGELRRRIGGVSEKMLAQTLRVLEQDGFVARHDFGEVPPRVEYALTPMGEDLARQLVTLAKWLATHTPAVLAARETYRATR